MTMQHFPMSFQQFADELATQLLSRGERLLAISGAQGIGKSTLARLIADALAVRGKTVAVVSLDDFYLSQCERAELAKRIDPRLMQRGVPGTHQLAKALQLTRLHLAKQPIALPRFDKALDEPAATELARHYDCLIIEGWCIGVAPVEPLAATDAYSEFIERSLALYQAWFALLTPLLYLQAPDWATVCAWRWQQEQQLMAMRGLGMNAVQLEKFMQAFLPLTQRAGQQLPTLADWQLQLDCEHQIIRIETVNKVG